ncbi:hypothetical protein R69658_07867 [Paraburkholderia aspalathi]|uniref:Uncharacterized protein n=1 Tax=Paraburkholderia aspalathi TaxID=1324617 RepID=A0ABN7NGS9_9BURK|nr:hypothetical protein R69658_07867 [Paraburkholderia aspalathi]
MLTALPVDRQNDFACSLIDVGNDIDDQRANKLLTCAHGDARCIPRSTKIFGELRKVRQGSLRLWCSHRLHARLAGLYTTQCRFPVLLQLRGNQAVLGITGGVAPLSQRGLVPGLLQFEFHDPLLLVQGIHVHLLSLLGRFDRQWLHDAQKLLADSRIDTGTTEPHTSR